MKTRDEQRSKYLTYALGMATEVGLVLAIFAAAAAIIYVLGQLMN